MEWKEVRLGDVCDLVAGYAFKAKDFGDFPHKVIKIGDINPPFVNYESELGVNLENYDKRKLEKYLVRYDDFVLAMTGATIGKVGRYIAQEPSYLNQRVLLFKAKENVCSKLLYYIVTSPIFAKYVINHIDSESAQPNISAGTISKYELQIPSSIDAQRRISSILSSLDRKIELNNKINATLEEMAQALFKSWFVDFEPFKNGNFIDTEIGKIPEGLTIALINDIPHLLETGRRPKGGVGTITSGVPSVGAEHVKGMGKYDFSKTKYIPAEYASTLKSGKINGYELLIYKDGGKPGYFIPNYSIFGEGYPFDECYLNEHVFKLDFEAGKWFNVFCYFYFQTDYVMNYLNAQGGKAAIPGINQNDVRSLYIFTPENDKVQEFGKSVLPLFKQILKNLSQNRTLTHLRDTLLPRLMSGEIEV